ncbi:hypothetical protein D3C75_572590 [compost metagenome]
MLFVVFKNRIEPEVIDDLLPCQPNQQTALIHRLNMAHADHIFHERIVIRSIDAPEGWQTQHRRLQILRLCFAHTLQDTHRLMVEQSHGKLAHDQRLDPFLAYIELNDRDGPQQRPRHPRGKLGFLVFFLRRDEDHLRGGVAPPPGPSQPLHEARAAVRRTELQHALQLAQVNAQLQRQRGCRHRRAGPLTERSLRLFTQHRGDAAVMDMEHVALPALRSKPPHLQDRLLGIRAAVGEDERLLQMRMVIDEAIIRLPRPLQMLGLHFVPCIREREMLHAKAQLAPALRCRDLYAFAGACGQPFRNRCVVAQCSRQPDPPRAAAGHARDPRQLAEHLDAAVRSHEGMHFINYNEAKVME